MMTEEGTLKLRIDRFSEFVANESQLFSDPTYIHGFSWRILVKPSEDPDVRLIFLECTGGDDVPNWSCQASVALHFVSQKDGGNDFIVKKEINLSEENYSGQLSKMNCSSLVNPNNGYIKDNTAIIRVYVKAEVPEDYLSFYSEYFKTMFRSDFKEGRKDEIVIEEVEYEEMIELLTVIYPSNAPITDWNLKYILKLADRFVMPSVLERCKKELRVSTLKGAQKLLLAQIYNFEDLQMEFARQYKSAEDVKKLGSEPEYSQFDYKTRALVLDSIAY